MNLAQNSQYYHTDGASRSSTTDGAGSSDSKANELVPESGVKEGLESYSNSDSGAGITSPLVPMAAATKFGFESSNQVDGKALLRN